MSFDLDPFADILPETTSVIARAGAKFQPKAKPRTRKETKTFTAPSSLPNATDPPLSEVTMSVQGNLQPRETADIFSELESLDDILSQSTSGNVGTVRKFQPKIKVNTSLRNKLPTSRPVDTSPQLVVSNEPANGKEAETFECNGDRLLGKESETFPDLECLDIISEATTTTGDAQLIPFETEYFDDDLTPTITPECFLDISTTSVSDSAPTDPPFKLPVTKEFTHLADASGLRSIIPEEVLNSQVVPVMSGKESTKSRKRKSSTVSEEMVRKFPSENVEELSQWAHDERPVLAAAVERNNTSKSSMQLRKRLTSPVIADEMEDDTQENGDPLFEPFNSAIGEEGHSDDNNEYKEETSRRKRAQSKSNKVVVGNKKTVGRHKNVSEVPDPLNKEPPKKRFSRSTRRNKRRVNKVLLETPEEEINPRKLILKDLIFLAEAKERLSNKDASAPKKSLPNQSVNDSFAQATLYDDDPFASMRGLNADDDDEATARVQESSSFVSMQGLNPDDEEATARVQESSFKLNYHSFMDRTPKERWSKQETELFYEAIQQFGTDFAMIQQLFPGRTRHQVKLKYKTEERQHPLKLSDVLINRSKDHSHFELVIERLQQAAAQAQQNFNIDMESVELTSKEGTPENKEEVAKSEQEGEEVAEDLEPDINGFVKSHESEDDLYRWMEPIQDDYDAF